MAQRGPESPFVFHEILFEVALEAEVPTALALDLAQRGG